MSLPTRTSSYDQETDINIGKQHERSSVQYPKYYDVENVTVIAQYWTVTIAEINSSVAAQASYKFIKGKIRKWKKDTGYTNKGEIHDRKEYIESLDRRYAIIPKWVTDG